VRACVRVFILSSHSKHRILFLLLIYLFLENTMREVRLKYMVRLNIISRTNWRTPFRAHLFTKCTWKYFLVSTTKYGAILFSSNVFDCHSDILFLSIMSGVAILRSCIKPYEVSRLQSFVLFPHLLRDSRTTVLSQRLLLSSYLRVNYRS